VVKKMKRKEQKMKKNKIFTYAGFCFMLLLLMVPDICTAADYEVLDSGFSIGTTQRSEWHPWVEYNSVDDEFMVIWRTSGKLRDDCDASDMYECENSFQGLMGQRISSGGTLRGSTITISPEEGPNDSVSWKMMPRHAYNPLRNEYLITFSVAENPDDPAHDNVIYKAVVAGNGTISNGPERLYTTLYNASHPDVAFSPVKREYLVVYNDKFFFREDEEFDNPGFILNEDGDIVTGPFIIGNPVGSNFAPYVDYNSTDDTYLLAWEDWRHGTPPWYMRPSEIYGALLDNEGNMIGGEITVIDDVDTDDPGTQLMPSIEHNPDRNEFLVIWSDTSPSFDGNAVLGRIIMPDGLPKGPDFVIVETKGNQSAPKLAYVQKLQRYFIVWDDGRDYTPPPDASPFASDNDIYAQWVDSDGVPIGDDIPIYVGEGDQSMPTVAYSPAMDSFLIAWRDANAGGDYEPVGPGAMMAPESKADVRGALYGIPSAAGWDDGMEIIVQDFAIENTPRHQWHPYVEYNSIDNEFIGVWRTSGKLRDDCEPGDEYECTTSFHTINGRRISPDGELLGDSFQLSPPEPGWKQVPRLAHNIFTNEYLVAFSRGPIDLWDMTIVKIDSVGDIQYGPERLMEPGEKALLPEVIFNPAEREYLVVYTDRDIFNPPYKNNIGFILNEDGTPRVGPFPVGSQLGDMYAPTGVYNSADNTYLIVWEDFRNVTDWLQPCDLYGVLLDADGEMIVEIEIVDDHPSRHDQRTPEVAYNPDRNEFLVVWQKNAEAGVLGDTSIYGLIIGPDGTPAGSKFVIVNAPRTQNMPQILYVEDMEKYFITWFDTRNDGRPEEDPWFLSPNLDIYARWLDPSGEPVGDEITITEEEGWQYSPYMAYNPVMKRFLIAWYEYGSLCSEFNYVVKI